MRRRPIPARPRPEPTVALINIVFLMLVFFLVAAQLSRPLEPDLRLVETADPSLVPPPDAVVLYPDGRARFRGETAVPEQVIAALQSDGLPPIAKILPDRAAPARAVIELAQALRAAGAEKVMIMTRQALK
ncbi:ExbD/TolR family protein [Thalassovita mangrovi]|uniref:Biopolymer transporter ExbD n=1 Tax=Thalassovita mangrovi TaxID=2692236 RepID=A0A6L8LJS3_9RHOB|nr:biopolymer transporter ExbD [Thalassovita mangrovi]MYM56224.1 biopolymer transporter ExbD [Thalassovita mangrovi]